MSPCWALPNPIFEVELTREWDMPEICHIQVIWKIGLGWIGRFSKVVCLIPVRSASLRLTEVVRMSLVPQTGLPNWGRYAVFLELQRLIEPASEWL